MVRDGFPYASTISYQQPPYHISIHDITRWSEIIQVQHQRNSQHFSQMFLLIPLLTSSWSSRPVWKSSHFCTSKTRYILSALLLLDVSINITFNIITTIQTSLIIRFLHQPNPLLSALLSDVTPDRTTARFTQTQIIIILLLLVGITMLKCGDNVFLHWRMVITTI